VKREKKFCNIDKHSNLFCPKINDEEKTFCKYRNTLTYFDEENRFYILANTPTYFAPKLMTKKKRFATLTNTLAYFAPQ
jgi:hypothetical protein